MRSLPVGTYEVTTEMSGFKLLILNCIDLAVAQEVVLNLRLTEKVRGQVLRGLRGLIGQIARLQYFEMMFGVTADQICQGAHRDGIVIGRTAAHPCGRIQVAKEADR